MQLSKIGIVLLLAVPIYAQQVRLTTQGQGQTAADQILGSQSASVLTFLQLVNCNSTNQAMQYATSTHTFSCVTIAGGGGGAVLTPSAIQFGTSSTATRAATIADFYGSSGLFGTTGASVINNLGLGSGGVLTLAYIPTIPNASLANPSTTVNGQPCVLGATCTIAVGTGNTTTTGTITNFYTLGTGTNAQGPGHLTDNGTTITSSEPVAIPAGSTLNGNPFGTVTSVAVAVPTRQTATAAVTGSGTITITDNTQSPAVVFAGPVTGSATAPTFRSLANTDLPASQVNNGGTSLTTNTVLVSTGTNTTGNSSITDNGTVVSTVEPISGAGFTGNSGSDPYIDMAYNSTTPPTLASGTFRISPADPITTQWQWSPPAAPFSGITKWTLAGGIVRTSAAVANLDYLFGPQSFTTPDQEAQPNPGNLTSSTQWVPGLVLYQNLSTGAYTRLNHMNSGAAYIFGSTATGGRTLLTMQSGEAFNPCNHTLTASSFGTGPVNGTDVCQIDIYGTNIQFLPSAVATSVSVTSPSALAYFKVNGYGTAAGTMTFTQGALQTGGALTGSPELLFRANSSNAAGLTGAPLFKFANNSAGGKGFTLSTINTAYDFIFQNTNLTANRYAEMPDIGTSTNAATLLVGNPYGAAAPTIATGPGAGTSPGTPTLTGNNNSGVVTLITGTATTAGAVLFTVTFNGTTTLTPQGCSVFAQNSAAAAMATTIYAPSPSSTTWTLKSAAAAVTASTTFVWSYICL